jgi:exopolyphosphatase/guanosine-5'-triphosphate,3'-diphosphate pyrophosphatase
MDIGGGSLELALAAEGLLDALESFPFGAIRATEQFLGYGGPTRGRTPQDRELRELRRAVRWAVRDVMPVKEWRGARVIGSGGTFTNLASVVNARLGLQQARGRHGSVIARADDGTCCAPRRAHPEQRATVPGLNPQRADHHRRGARRAGRGAHGVRGARAPRVGLRHPRGAAARGAAGRADPADPGEARERSVRAFAERCRYESRTPSQVRASRCQLSTSSPAGLRCEPGRPRDPRRRRAACTTSGYHISYEKHHKHSYHLILHADLLG